MKKPIKKTIIVTAAILAITIGLGVIFAFIPLGGVRQYSEFHTATIITQGHTVGGTNNIRLFNQEGINEDEYDFYNRLTRGIRRTRYTLLNGIFEWGIRPRISIPDDERRLSVSDINALFPREDEFLLKIEFDEPRTLPRSVLLLDELALCECDENSVAPDYRTVYDTIVFRVIDSANEITWIDAYAFNRAHMNRINPYDDCSPLHYQIVPMRIRVAPTRLFRAIEDIVEDWARMPLPRD